MTLLPWLEAPARDILASLRSHAILLAAPEGVGQFELAHHLARAWLCEAGGDRAPCGQCPSCQLVEARTHPDLLVLLPEALQEELGWTADGEGSAKASKAKPSKEIKVDALRSAVEFAQQTSSRGVAKVVLIHPAERMNAISANTLLKTLEEPPGLARFVLSTGAIDQLLPTIRSRCQHVTLGLPSMAQASEWLGAQGVAEPEVLLAAAGHQPLMALQMARQGLDAAAWRALPSQLAQGRVAAVSGWSASLLVATLQKLCHDAMRAAAGAQPVYFPAGSVQARADDLPRLVQWSQDLIRVARHDEHPWNAGLLAESLVAQAQRALHSAR